VIRRGGEILVQARPDSVKNLTGYRPLGGGIKFMERGASAAQRELLEEIGAVVTEVEFMGLVENIFTHEGRPGHEIALVFEGRFADPSLYAQDTFIGREERGEPIHAGWKALSEFWDEGAPLYPSGLLALLIDRWRL
jgi:8-oxo-dGTP pyrophosphatase MutT (NUDIX family)